MQFGIFTVSDVTTDPTTGTTPDDTQRVRDIPEHVLPFIIPRRKVFEDAASGGDITLALNASAREITVSGDREAVTRVVQSIKSAVD